MSKIMTNPHWVRTYILAGHARLTITSKRSQARYTFQVSQMKDRETGKPVDGGYFVGLLTGPNNEGDYTYLGMIKDNAFKATKATRGRETSAPFLAFNWFWVNLMLHNNLRVEQMEVRHEGTCGRCGRVLTVPESIDRGIGPECANKMGIMEIGGTAPTSPKDTRKRRYNPRKPRATRGELAQAQQTRNAMFNNGQQVEQAAPVVSSRDSLDDSDFLRTWNN